MNVTEEPSYLAFARMNVREGLLTSTSVVRELLARIDRDASALKADQPVMVTTPDELDALPGGSIIRDSIGFAWQKYNKPISDKPAWFSATRNSGFYYSTNLADGGNLPATVLYEAKP